MNRGQEEGPQLLRSGPLSRSWLHSMASRSVRCLATAVLIPPVKSPSASSSLLAISYTASAPTRAAASSKASGMPPSLRQICATACALEGVSANEGSRCWARSTNKRTDS